MSRKNTMLGLAALAALGFAATSFAQCPSSPVPPWSGQSALGGSVEIVENGYDGTSCRLDSALTNNIGGAAAFVRDDTPADEGRYRAQFLIDADGLAGQNTIQTVKVFGASTDNAFGGNSDLVRLTVVGNISGTAKTLGVFTACEGQPSNLCSTSVPLTPGVNRVEIDWQQGASGSLAIWVNNTNEASPTATLNANNASWGGVDFATLGLTAGSSAFRAAQLNNTVGFDEFDSRRTTFIGN